MANKSIVWIACMMLLLGAVSQGNSDVLCIGDDGHAEFETVCLPCCADDSETCENSSSDDQHEEHSECQNCSDVDLTNPLIFSRDREIDSINAESVVSDAAFEPYTVLCCESGVRHAGFESPPDCSANRSADLIAVSVIRC